MIQFVNLCRQPISMLRCRKNQAVMVARGCCAAAVQCTVRRRDWVRTMGQAPGWPRVSARWQARAPQSVQWM